jgi:hypothetical protein
MRNKLNQIKFPSIQSALMSENKTQKHTYSEKLKNPKWQKKRLEILNRDKFTCRNCGDNENPLNVHHIAYNYEHYETNNSLLITLCEDCHNKETEQLKIQISKLIKSLKESGFMSLSFGCLSTVFKDKDRGWAFYEPAFDIIKMAINDDDIWSELERKFWERLSNKLKDK